MHREKMENKGVETAWRVEDRTDDNRSLFCIVCWGSRANLQTSIY